MKSREEAKKESRAVTASKIVALVCLAIFFYMMGYSNGQSDTYEKIQDNRLEKLYKTEVDGK